MTDEWVEMTLGEVSECVKRGRAPKYSDDGTLVLNQKCVREGNRIDLTPSRRTDGESRPIPEWAFLRPGDVLVNSTGRGTLGRAAFVAEVREPTTVDSHVTIVRPDAAKVVPAFLGLVCAQMNETFVDLGSGSTNQTELSRTAIAAASITVPPLSAQQRIVDLMRHLDTHLSNLQAERDAVRALVASLREELLTPREGWTRATLGELTTKIGSGATPRGGEASYKTHGVSLIRSQNVHDGAFSTRGLAKIDPEQARALEGVTVQPGDCLTNITGASVNRTCVVPDDVLPARVNQHVAILRASTGKTTGLFISHSLRRLDTRRLMDRMATAGTTRQAITKSQLAALVIDVPAEFTEQVAIVTTLCNVEGLIRSLEGELASLRSLRATVLSTLLAGTLEVPDSYDELMGVE